MWLTKYTLCSVVLTHPGVPFMKLEHFKSSIDFKIEDLYLLTPVALKFGPFDTTRV